jgi:hypothetical protein
MQARLKQRIEWLCSGLLLGGGAGQLQARPQVVGGRRGVGAKLLSK